MTLLGSQNRWVGGAATLQRLQYLFQPPCADPDTISAPLLTALTLPDGSAYAMSYIASTSGGNLSGGIESLRLPTGGGAIRRS